MPPAPLGLMFHSFSFDQPENLQEKLRTVDIWEMENQRIGERKKEEAFKSAVDDRAWIPITEAFA